MVVLQSAWRGGLEHTTLAFTWQSAAHCALSLFFFSFLSSPSPLLCTHVCSPPAARRIQAKESIPAAQSHQWHPARSGSARGNSPSLSSSQFPARARMHHHQNTTHETMQAEQRTESPPPATYRALHDYVGKDDDEVRFNSNPMLLFQAC